MPPCAQFIVQDTATSSGGEPADQSSGGSGESHESGDGSLPVESVIFSAYNNGECKRHINIISPHNFHLKKVFNHHNLRMMYHKLLHVHVET